MGVIGPLSAIEQEPINIGDADYDPLYPFGWGLRTKVRGHGHGHGHGGW